MWQDFLREGLKIGGKSALKEKRSGPMIRDMLIEGY